MNNKTVKKTESIKMSRERKALLSQYATAAVCLYGVISIDEFVEVFNGYETAHTSNEEVLSALLKFSQTDDVEYSISGDILSGPEFQPQFKEYKENIEIIRDCQSGKPRYLPDKKEFLKYLDFLYREPEKPYARLKAYILKHQLTNSGEGIEGVDGDLIDLYEMIRFGVKPTEELEYFTGRGYQYKDINELNEFSQLVMNVHNNTRIYDNNGFTPNEMILQPPKLRLQPGLQKPHPESLGLQPLPKVSRNELCPCGSGLKYKKCHGK